MGTIKRRLGLFSQHCVVLITKSMLKWIFTSQQICIEENSATCSYLVGIVMRKKFKYHIDCRYDCVFKFPASEFNTIFFSFPSEWRHTFLSWHFQVCTLKLKKAISSFCRQFWVPLQCCPRLTHVSFFVNPLFVLCCSAAKLFICSITDAYFTLYFSLQTICINLRNSYGTCFTFKVSQKS